MTDQTICSVCKQPIGDYSVNYNRDTGVATHVHCFENNRPSDYTLEEIKTLLEAVKKIVEKIELKVREL